MRIERLARDEQTHDFARSFENKVDPEVAQKPLDGYRLLAARSERLRRFVAAPAADLHCVIDNFPGALASPQLAKRGFEPDISGFVAINDAGGEKHHRFHRENLRSDARQLFRNGSMFADGRPPLDTLPGPLPRDG